MGAELPADLCWQVGAAPNGRLDVTVTGRVVEAGSGAAGTYPADADLVFPRRAQAFKPSTAVVPAGTPIPVVGAAQAQKHRLRELLVAGPLSLSVATTAHRSHDSVIGAPGANDGGSGTGLCLELARVPCALPTEATVAFSLWGSEEQGLIGSRCYVRELPHPERDRLTGVFQNDMVATSWDPATRYWLLSFTGLNNVITQAVIDSARRLGYEPEISPVTQRGASDHQSFQEVGIDSANFSWRAAGGRPPLSPPDPRMCTTRRGSAPAPVGRAMRRR